MGEIVSAFFLCTLVLMIAVIASVVASIILSRRMIGRAKELASQSVAVDGALQVAPIAGGLTVDDAMQLRNLLLRTAAPNAAENVVWARRRWPEATPDQLARRIINAEAQKCGFIGFVTGMPGLLVMPVTLPVDILATGRLQAAMVESLAYVYAAEIEADELERMKWMVLLGGGSLARTAVQLTAKIVGQGALKAMPVLGAVTGYAANYFLAQAAGRVAMARFSGTLTVEQIGRVAIETRQNAGKLAGAVQNQTGKLISGASSGVAQLSEDMSSGVAQLSGGVKNAAAQLNDNVSSGVAQLSGGANQVAGQLSDGVSNRVAQLSGGAKHAAVQLSSGARSAVTGATARLQRAPAALPAPNDEQAAEMEHTEMAGKTRSDAPSAGAAESISVIEGVLIEAPTLLTSEGIANTETADEARKACPSCATLNPTDFRFCMSCGASLGQPII